MYAPQGLFLSKCMMNEMINNIRNMIKITLAASTMAMAIPEKPKMPAMTEIIKKRNTQDNKTTVVPVTKRIRAATNRMIKTKNITCAIVAKAMAMLVNPNNAATMAIAKNVNTHPIMIKLLMISKCRIVGYSLRINIIIR